MATDPVEKELRAKIKLALTDFLAIAMAQISARRFSRSSIHYRPQLFATATNNLLAV